MSKIKETASRSLLQRVKSYIKAHALLTADATYLVALSGGADSVALLLALHELHYPIEAAHCNFHLREEASDKDEAFCMELCRALNIKLHLAHFDTRAYASLHHISIEMAARNLRYRYFENLRKDIGAAGICVAHHQDDNVETVLLNLIRGTGIYGLTGMKPKHGKILRPLLCVNKTDILNFLEDKQQHYRTDASNLIPDVQRNKIRLEIIPALQQINPAATRNILKTVDYLTSIEHILANVLQDVRQRVIVSSTNSLLTISIKALIKEPLYQDLLWYILKDYGFHEAQVKQILASLATGTGKRWESKTSVLTINREMLLVKPLVENTEDTIYKIPETGNYSFTNTLHLTLSIEENHANYLIGKEPKTAFLDADKVQFPLILRHFQQGERFVPFGMTGKKLISDYLTDKKCSLFEKQQQMVLTDATGEIIWLVNQRTDNRYKVTTTTRRILKIVF